MQCVGRPIREVQYCIMITARQTSTREGSSSNTSIACLTHGLAAGRNVALEAEIGQFTNETENVSVSLAL